MNLTQLRYFNAVCEFGTVSTAAEYLHVAQPSVSLAIKQLESEFGLVLFKRIHKGMQLTQEGKTLLNLSKNILEQVESAEKIMRDIGKNKKVLKLGVPPMIGSLILPKLYNEFALSNTDVSLEIEEYGLEEMLKKIESDVLDMAFIAHDTIANPDIETLSVEELEIVCCSSKKVLLNNAGEITPTSLSSFPLVTFKEGFFQNGLIKSWFAKQNVCPNVLMKTDQLSTMLKIITSGTAIGFIFKKLLQTETNLNYYTLNPKITVNVSLIWKKNKFFSSGMKKFKHFLQNAKIFD